MQEELDRQRNRYAGRAVGYVVWLNGLAAIALLIGLLHGASSTAKASSIADAMMVFGFGASAGLIAALFGYLRRTVHIEQPNRVALRVLFAWLGLATTVVAAVCFVWALNMGRMAITT
jgi:hypothetical protein